MENKRSYIIEECGFCGNKTKMDIVGQHCESEDITYYDERQDREIEEWIS